MAHMLPSLDATSSASATLNLSRLNTDALHGSCLRFGPRVTATPARLGSGPARYGFGRVRLSLTSHRQLLRTHCVKFSKSVMGRGLTEFTSKAASLCSIENGHP